MFVTDEDGESPKVLFVVFHSNYKKKKENVKITMFLPFQLSK